MIPSTIRITPLKKNIEKIKLVHPVTEYPHLSEPKNIHIAPTIEKLEKNNPIPIATFKGLSENERIMSEAKRSLFLKVYEGFPESLEP